MEFAEFLKKNHEKRFSVSTSSAKGGVLHAMADFFSVTRIAPGWCKALKPVHQFNLTVIWGGFFHNLFNRLVEILIKTSFELGNQPAPPANNLSAHPVRFQPLTI